MNAPLFQLRDLDFAYPSQPSLLRKLCLTVCMGDRILLTGTNGSGKSTLLDLLAGILKPSSGMLLLLDKAPAEQSPEAFLDLVFRRQKAEDDLFGLVPRHDLEAWRLAWPERFSEPVVQGLKDPLMDKLDTPYSRLSAGELRAFTLLWLPLLVDKFWLLDEPTAGLDPSRKQRFGELCAAKEAPGYLIVSHSGLLPNSLFTRVLSLENGALKELG
jgi:ABC-type transport system involved in cytochrome c biogenesis ATPase subunit